MAEDYAWVELVRRDDAIMANKAKWDAKFRAPATPPSPPRSGPPQYPNGAPPPPRQPRPQTCCGLVQHSTPPPPGRAGH